jgi:S1-C subfamily serine protease
MKKFLLVLALSVLSLAACDCTTTKYVSVGNSAATDNSAVAPRQARRHHNQKLMSHITARTVQVNVDCTPKKGIVVVGVKNPKRYGDGSGSAIIVQSREGISYLFTAAHVVEMSRKKEAKHFDCVITVQRSPDVGTKNNKHVATIVAANTNHDVAVLSVATDFGVNTELEMNVFTGEDIWAAGYPMLLVAPSADILSITKGTLATKNIPVRGSVSRNGYWHRVTAQLYFGNSGGGVWSKSGKLVAIVSALAAGEERMPYEGNYFVKPVIEVISLLDKKGKLKEVFDGVK